MLCKNPVNYSVLSHVKAVIRLKQKQKTGIVFLQNKRLSSSIKCMIFVVCASIASPFFVFERSPFCSPRQHLFDQKSSQMYYREILFQFKITFPFDKV